jgi:hypothetical protein
MQSDSGVGQRSDFLRIAQKSSANISPELVPLWNGICNNHLNETPPNPSNLSRT